MPKDKLEMLISKRNALDARIQQMKNREGKEKRKKDTQRKVLVGAAVLDEASKHPPFKAEIDALLHRFLKRDDQRAVCGLSPLLPAPPEEKTQKPVKAKNKTVPKTTNKKADPNAL
jgi:hypothetical protein